MSSVKAPWTDEQVAALNINQRSGHIHPYTCGNCRDNGVEGECELVATTLGWVCPTCDNTQDWCHRFSTEVIPSPWPGLEGNKE